MRSHSLEHSFPEWKPCIGLIRLPAVLGLCLRSALDAFLSVMTTPIVRAKWRHELEIYKSRRRARAQSRLDGGPSKEIGGRLKIPFKAMDTVMERTSMQSERLGHVE